ncbi:hypothetical protein G6F40_014460 [Rhizopus arrhizus]|nr:hypothetical protein G6F40_014460 [Rhizopus arrhizus]
MANPRDLAGRHPVCPLPRPSQTAAGPANAGPLGAAGPDQRLHGAGLPRAVHALPDDERTRRTQGAGRPLGDHPRRSRANGRTAPHQGRRRP